MGETGSAYRVLLCKFEGERPFGRSGHRWEDDVKSRSGGSRTGVGRGGAMNGIDLAKDRDKWLLWTLMYLQVPQSALNFLTSSGTISFSRRALLLGVSVVCS